MSATLTWFNSGLATKTGTGVANLFADLETLIDSKAGDANFSWAKASSNVGSSPYYLVLKPKSGAAGRILLLTYSSAPAANNAAIFTGNPAANNIYCTYFPSGNVDTPSNLTAASGTILGDDSGVLTCVVSNFTAANIYGASYQAWYFDSAEAVAFGFQNPANNASCMMTAAGDLVIDANDDAYPAVWRSTNSAVGFGTSNAVPIPWTTSSQAPSTTSANSAIMTNYGGANSTMYMAMAATGNWAAQAVGADDILSDTANSRAYFVPCPLISRTKGQGFALKLRQIGYGPGTTAAFTEYSTTGPVTAARQFNACSTGGAGNPWFTNFKL